jgi:DNA-binding IclR family transcriptional regulator
MGRDEKAAPRMRGGAKASASVAAAGTFGTQSISRAIAMLREIAARGAEGMRLVDVAAATKLERPTAHRIIKGLAAEGMVMQDPETRRYHLGHLAYELGLAAIPRFNLREMCEPALKRVAEKTGDSVFLFVRSGLDGVCIDRVHGSFPIKAYMLEVGGRRPLGVGAGSLALLMALPEGDIERIIETNAPRFASTGQLTAKRLQRAILRSRQAGYAINDEDVLPGVSAIAVPIVPKSGLPYAAVSIAGIASRFAGQRREELARILVREVRSLEKMLSEYPARAG